MGNYSEFDRALSIVLKNIDVDANVNVSVFETNIRGIEHLHFTLSSFSFVKTIV